MGAEPRSTNSKRYRKGQITFADFPTRSAAFRGVLDQITRYAKWDVPILLLGENGVGKNFVAQAIHNASRRSARPFIPKNLAQLRPETLDSELFGHVEGAFTGASRNRKGLFRAAEGGTVLLDELGKAPMHVQYALLQVVENRLVAPMGADLPEHVNIRFVFAASLRLADLGREDLLCPDLVTRIGPTVFTLPPLRERPEDISLLADRMLAEVAEREGLARPPVLSAEALRVLERRAWRGNVRELRSVLGCAVANGEGETIRPEHIDPEILPGALAQAPQTRRESLHEDVRRALAECGGHKKTAARRLGISVNTLRKVLEQIG